jgi:hypothetical protein
MLYPWHNVIFHPYLISLKLISFLLTTYLLCLVTCFSTDSRHTYEYKVSSSSCRIVPLFVWGGLHKKNEKKLARSFNFTFCFIDNVLSLNDYRCGDFVELEVRNTTDTDRSVSHLDIHIEIDSERRLRTKLYDKRDDFNFPIVNFSFIFSNIPAAPAYGVYISQLIQYSRACGSYQESLDRGLLLTRKLLNQGFFLVMLKSSQKFCGRHHDLVDRYGISVSQMTRNMFHLSWILPGPLLFHELSPGLHDGCN